MPNRVGQFEIWERLRARFLLEPILPHLLKTIGDQVVPVTNVDPLLLVPAAANDTGDLTGSAGTYVAVFTVPEGKRWTVRNLLRFGSTGSSALMASVAGQPVFLTSTGTGGEALNSMALTLNENDSTGLRATANGADTAVRSDIVYDEEDAF